MEQKTVNSVLNKIRTERSKDGGKTVYTTASQKDEVSVMRSMLNDKNHNIDLYDNESCNRLFCVSIETKDMVSKIISTQCDIPFDQAKRMVDDYEFDNEDAQTMIDISKQFVSTYLTTGRKLAFDSTRNTEIALSEKHVPEHTVFHPVKINHKDGSSETIIRETKVSAYDQVKAYSRCPTWKRNLEKNELDPEAYENYPPLYDGEDYYSQFGYCGIISTDNVYINQKHQDIEDTRLPYSSSFYKPEDEFDIYGRRIVMRIKE